jgi:hypothetical protein
MTLSRRRSELIMTLNQNGMTMREIGRQLGISGVRVMQLRNQIKRRTMCEYLVEWDFDVELDNTGTPRDAAMEALAAQRNPESSATVFKVTDKATGTVTVVDLGEQPAVEYRDKEYGRGYVAADIEARETLRASEKSAE